MKLTSEQQSIIQSTGDIKINAVAGSGKTTTIIEYAKSRPSTANILYLAFNKSVKVEAQKKFLKKGLKNVIVETAHSLAYNRIVRNSNYILNSKGYKIHEIVEILGIVPSGEKHYEFIIANHVIKFISYFCNSDKLKVQELDYRDVVFEPKAKIFVNHFYRQIEDWTRKFLGKMDSAEIEITHDFYLKKFQLSNPQLSFDYILFDEAQDASPAMLDVVLKQSAIRVIVGDENQQIYGWRFAVNSLGQVDYPVFELTASFRFRQEIAEMAMKILAWKKHLKKNGEVSIIGLGNSSETKSKAIIARTNLGLLLKAIEKVTESSKLPKIYFEGNINSYTYADNGTSLYDVLNLYLEKRNLIRDKLIGSMKNLAELSEYIDKTDDLQLGMMVEVVREYGTEIPGIIKKIKEAHVADKEREMAEIIFSTVHRCKGMEYDSIELANDFITEEKLLKLISDSSNAKINFERINEEINLLYVAVTRTKNLISIPVEIDFNDIIKSSKVKVITKKSLPITEPEVIEKLQNRIQRNWGKLENEFDHGRIRKAGSKEWSGDMDNTLSKMFKSGKAIIDIADFFNVSKNSITSQLSRLGFKTKGE